jgi:hypothetical protein
MSESGFRTRRALVTFALAYVVVTVLAAALSISLEAAMHVPPTPAYDMVHSPSYLLSEKFYPILNLLVWTTFAWVYFGPRARSKGRMPEAFRLGALWLGLALIVDYVGFVLIRHPYSLNAHDFYVEQFPWIYLVYAALLVSPALYATLARTSS